MIAENILHAVEIANKLRAAFGEPTLDDLPAAKPGKSQQCVLARAFNFGCKVDTLGVDTEWSVAFPEDKRAQAEVLAELVGTKPYDVKDWLRKDDTTIEVDAVRVDLPNDVGDIAHAFDMDELPARYYEGYQGTNGDLAILDAVHIDEMLDEDVDTDDLAA